MLRLWPNQERQRSTLIRANSNLCLTSLPCVLSRPHRPYMMDLESANGTQVNGEAIPPARYYEIMANDVIKFAFSSRECKSSSCVVHRVQFG